MFLLIKDWKFISYWNTKIKQQWCKVIEKNFTESEIQKLKKGCEIKITKWTLEIIETEEYLENIKQEKLSVIHKKARNRIKNEVYIRKERNWIIEYYDDWEIKTWSTKVKEAKIIIWGWESELLSSYTPTGLTVKKYAKKILKKAKTKSILVAEIEKEKNDAINNLFNN